MDGISRPLRSINQRLIEIVLIEDKSYIMFLQEKAHGKLVDINNVREFNKELFFNLSVMIIIKNEL